MKFFLYKMSFVPLKSQKRIILFIHKFFPAKKHLNHAYFLLLKYLKE
ncbi:hypothetical protein L950_0218010 [Sphingobacterium sp. IITKGP-BTPF85]|nr:hypothetical protein L950_0218010 [Sphingobacterium sp. IITKGP-BTPF85]